MSLSPSQCRAARGLLGMSQDALCKAADVTVKTLSDFENGKTTPWESTLANIEAALVRAGAEFIPENGGGAGVRLKKRGKGLPNGEK